MRKQAHQFGRELLDAGDAEETHPKYDLALENADRLDDAGLAVRLSTCSLVGFLMGGDTDTHALGIQERTSHSYRLGTKAKGLQDVWNRVWRCQ